MLKMDGGICSQIHFYLIGQILSEQNEGDIYYDLNWYKHNGKDCNNNFVRNFDLLKAFPHLILKKQKSGLLRRIYISFFYNLNKYRNTGLEDNPAISNIKAPAYIDGYFHYPDDVYLEKFSQIFRIESSVLPKNNMPIYNEIINSNQLTQTCAVHVRRGDLALSHPIYGEPTDLNYYLKSFEIISKIDDKTRYFVFSDEPDWFKKEILPHLFSYDISIVDINGSDRGWCDLILMSRCTHQITSQGSMGKYAAMLRDKNSEKGMVIMPSNEMSKEWINKFKSSKIII